MTLTTPAKIAGIFQYPDAKAEMKAMQVGDEFTPIREPENKHDANAIALLTPRGTKCGYLPRQMAANLKDKKIIKVTKGQSFDMCLVVIE